MPLRYTRFFSPSPENQVAPGALHIYKVLKYRYATALFRKPGTSDGTDPLLRVEEGREYSKVHDANDSYHRIKMPQRAHPH